MPAMRRGFVGLRNLGLRASATARAILTAQPPPTPAEIATAPEREITRRLQAQARTWYLGDRTAMCLILTRRLIFVDTSDYTLAPHLMRDGFWEMWVTRAMARCLRPGMTAIDVGANVGYYTVLMAEAIGSSGRVLAFEPVPRMAELLRRTLSVNGYEGFCAVQECAAWHSSGGTIGLRIMPGRAINATVQHSDAPPEEVVQVPLVALDDVLPPRVDFIKIDVEGAEQEVWSGLRATIERNPDIRIMLEFNLGRYPETGAAFLDGLVSAGLQLFHVTEGGAIEPCSREHALSQEREDIILVLQRLHMPRPG